MVSLNMIVRGLSAIKLQTALAITAVFGISAVMFGQAPDLSQQSLAIPRLSVFLADKELGVAGAYQSGAETLYFEAETPTGSTQMSVRLLDGSGRTIAIAGHSMDSLWLASAGFDPAAANRSLSLAAELPNALANTLDGQLYVSEIAALSKLALGVAQAAPAAFPAVIDSAVENLPARDLVARDAANTSDLVTANQLSVAVNTPETLRVALGGVNIETFAEYFPDGDNDDNPPGVVGRTEVSARIVSSNGKSLIQQIGGDYIPDGWDSQTNGMFRSGSLQSIDPIQSSIEAGKAIKAAALIARFPSVATQEEAEAIGNLSTILRNDSLFPTVTSDSSATPAASCGNCYKSSVQVWHKSLVVVAQHSGSVVLHYNNNNPSRFPVLEIETVYCNHGTCPGLNPMVHPCTYNGPWMSRYRFAPHARITAPPPNPPSGNHSCYKTQYKVYSGTFWPVIHAHNCNDDTWTQVRAIRGESYHLTPSDNPFTSGARCDNHNFADPRSPGCSE